MLVAAHKDSDSLLVKQVIASAISRLRVPRFVSAKHNINTARSFANDTRELLELIETHKKQVLMEYKKVLGGLEREGAVNYSVEKSDSPTEK
jgi:hypothetical protein